MDTYFVKSLIYEQECIFVSVLSPCSSRKRLNELSSCIWKKCLIFVMNHQNIPCWVTWAAILENIVIQHRYIKTWRMFHIGNVNVAHANSQQIQSRFVIFDIRIYTMEKSLWCCLINASILINTSSALTWKVNLAPRSNHYLHVISAKPLSVKSGIKADTLQEVTEL